MADDMRRGGLMDEETHQQITMRHLAGRRQLLLRIDDN
jgi:hypothetical protein